MERVEGQQRLFFALWPDNGLRQAIASLQGLRNVKDFGRRIPLDNIHITLAFLGNVDKARKECIAHEAGSMHGRSFKLVLDRLGYWSRPQILWLGPSHIPHELESLSEMMNARLLKCGMTSEERPYKPHLTLARNVKKPPPRIKIEPVTWDVKRYSLMESLPVLTRGVNYQELACWELS